MNAGADDDVRGVPSTMCAVLLTGHGGFEMLEYRSDVRVPVPATGEVLVRVGAAGINNTDINTRIGWYSKQVGSDTAEGASAGLGNDVADDASWTGEPLHFPRIQGADAVGTIVLVGDGVEAGRVGRRVLVRPIQGSGPTGCITYGSEVDGAFAQYAICRDEEAFPIDSELTDVELASFPCAYSTAEGLLHRAGVEHGERVLITGSSGGVGSAAVQLAVRRGAEVVAVASESKWDAVGELGATTLIGRDTDYVAELGVGSVDVVIDLVAGPKWPQLLEVLRAGGRYATAGAIAGPIVELDVRTLYLKDLTLIGCTYQPRVVFENLVRYIESGEVRPVVAKSYPLADVITAQTDFLGKQFTGKLILVPPGD